MEISIETIVNASIETVWAAWTTPKHVTQWNFASTDWECPRAEVDLQVGGRFNYRMEAKDGSMGFDFEGTFTSIEPGKEIVYTLGDDRKVTIKFEETEVAVKVIETFRAEDDLSAEQQRQGWQSILNNFKKHVEAGGA